MPRRHAHQIDDWTSIATRLDEIISAHSGEEPFEEALKLLIARVEYEAAHRRVTGWLDDIPAGAAPDAVSTMLTRARARWPGVLDADACCRLAEPELRRCAEVLEGSPLLATDLSGLDHLFEHVVTRAAKGLKGQYFTPRFVVDAVVRMVAPEAGERVVDPACGSGAFLRHTLLHSQAARVVGVDQDPRAVRVARAMLALSGENPPAVHRGDSLQTDLPSLPAGEFDVVLTNPPFAGDVGAHPGYALSAARRVERDVLFLERAVGLLRPGGRLGIVLPHNTLGGRRWGFVRDWLLRETRVVAVVGLGRNTFQPHTSQKACVLIAVRRTRALAAPSADESILFVIPDRDGKDARGRVIRRVDGTVDHDLGDAIPAVRAALEGPHG
jgi:type I restriction enzyme M protein